MTDESMCSFLVRYWSHQVAVVKNQALLDKLKGGFESIEESNSSGLQNFDETPADEDTK